jgi:hypothetical protein
VSDALGSLDAIQRRLLHRWLPGLQVIKDHSWGLADNAVLHVDAGGRQYIVKADGPSHHHIQRELDAHELWLAPWVAAGRAPRLVAGNRAARILVTEYLPGDLVLGAPAQADPGTFHQAGELLALLHGQPGRIDTEYEAHENSKVLANLEKDHRIDPAVHARVRELIRSWASESVTLVPTHGDWQPRNWLVHTGTVSIIDFGRAALRPALSDWVRLAARDFLDDPLREAAFVQGYGSDPRDAPAWFAERLREAVNTAVWAHLVGDQAFEAEGHAAIDRVLDEA